MTGEQDLKLVWRVASRLGVSKTRVYQLVYEGKLAAVKLGARRMMITVDSLNAYIDKHPECYKRVPQQKEG